jgi:hypothetical protein
VYGSVGSTWSRQSKIVAADGATGDGFGSGVSICGMTAMIGSRFDNDKATNEGIINNNNYILSLKEHIILDLLFNIYN